MNGYDLAVVGGGPAGLAGAAAAARAGLSVVLLDSGARLGGQYFRHPAEGFHAARPGALHHGFGRFLRLAADVTARADVRLNHRVWSVERGADGVVVRCLAGDREERPVTVTARRLLIATGAYDRSLPFPGWDLPGVLTAGGAQALLKGDLVAAGRRIVVAGTGPFLLPVGAGLAAAGADVLGVYEANPWPPSRCGPGRCPARSRRRRRTGWRCCATACPSGAASPSSPPTASAS
ncbi:FAD-dependent oxidoreductase [Thermocatellispora tengchongensis]|uniref:FAD-dependent oxidoreductase n=1 Tax=Thermocatellispora tengchongensis TaxID=1073253 RepID=UPI00363A7F3A